MIEKYKAKITRTYTSIIKYNVVKETKHRITYVREHKNWKTNCIENIKKCENKISNNYTWFDSFDEAKIYCIMKHNEKIKYFKTFIKYHETEILKLNDLT